MAIVKKYPAEVVAVRNLIENIFTVSFKSLSNRSFKYYPGQFLHLTLDEYDPSMGWTESRCFSMQSSPNEDNLEITYAVKGDFTKRMAKELLIGKLVTLKLPYGDLFTKHHDKENSVFISGGTGITPFLSMFKSPDFIRYKNPVLYAGFRSEFFNVYTCELKLAKTINSSFQINCVYQNDKGLLDIKKIKQENDSKSTYFISGPPVMIKSFKGYLISNDLLEEQILTDDWE